jgi:hypothetical protein
MPTLKEMQEFLIDNADPSECVELLELSTEDLVKAFPSKVKRHKHKFMQFFDEEGGYDEEQYQDERAIDWFQIKQGVGK